MTINALIPLEGKDFSFNDTYAVAHLRICAILACGTCQAPGLAVVSGQLVTNWRKPERDGKYDELQGNVVGTATRTKRFDIARHLKRAAQ